MKKNGEIKRFPFVEAGEALGFGTGNDASEKVILNQEYPHIRYAYPGYFLNNKQLARVLKSGVVPYEVLGKYIDGDINAILENPQMNNFSRLGHLLMTEGPIEGTNITGEELRQILNRDVADGPTLRLMKVPEWRLGIEYMLEFASKSDTKS